MNTRLDTIRSLAETDPYWRAYLAGMRDEHAIGRDDDRTAELVEANRLLQAQLDRARDVTRRETYTVEEVRAPLNARRTPNAADLGAPRYDT